MEIFKKRLRERVDLAKKNQGKSQRDLAKLMDGVSHERFNKWLTTLNEPRLAHLCQLAQILDTHVGYLVGEDDDPIPPKKRDTQKKLDNIMDMIKS